jgi:5,10-methenyltetrahydrofolate synthetase
MGATRSKREWREWAKGVGGASLSDGVVASLREWPPLHGTVLSYLAMEDEVDLRDIHSLDRCRVAITRTPEFGPLSVHIHQPDKLESHRLGYEQPRLGTPTIAFDDIDVVLVPGLVFDQHGNRLGRGKGYYDALLSQLPVGTVRVGVTVDELLVDEIATEDHDQRVAWVATESGIHRTGVAVPDATQRFISAAITRGIGPDIHRFPDGTRTSADAAAAVGSELGEIAKSILFMVDDDPVLVIASGDRRISEQKLAGCTDGESVRIASLEEVREHTGYVAGGTPAVGLSQTVKVLADGDLARYRWVWSAGGTPDTVFPVALDRLIAASEARWVEVTDRGKM